MAENKSLEQLAELVRYMKYAKYLPEEKRRETWAETVERNKQMQLRKFPQAKELIDSIYERVLDKKILPSGRSLQFGGPAVEQNNGRIYNCSFRACDDLNCFSDLFYNLLLGCGVGISVKKRHIDKLPALQKPTGTVDGEYTIEDSIEGWAESIKVLMQFYTDPKSLKSLKMDYSRIRPAGALIHSSMCPAPGPEPLKAAHEKVRARLDEKLAAEDFKLHSIDVFDICCWCAQAVLSGGVRRSSILTLFDKDDQLMLHAKEGEWYKEHSWRGVSNNSVQLRRDNTTEEEFRAIFDVMKNSGCGEPGFVWTNDEDFGVNPCCEISIPSKGFCNLTEINMAGVTTQAELEDRVYYATALGTLQAAYTDLKYVDNEWQEKAEDMALTGVSMTGLATIPDLTVFDFDKAAEFGKLANEQVAKLIGIKPAERRNAIKPSGTASLVLGTSSGIHAWHAPYYWRRIRVNKLEPLYGYMIEKHPDLVEDDCYNGATTAVITLAVKAPDNALTRNDQTAIEFLERVKYLFEHWIKPGHTKGANYNNISCTVSVRKTEWDEVCDWMWANRENYTGISLLPYDDTTYQQAPFEECTKEEYEAFWASDHEFDLASIKEEKNFVDFQAEAACSANGCEVF